MTTRSLTPNEITLARTLYGDSIDYAAVRVHDRRYARFQKENVAMTPDGSLYMNALYRDDYALESSNMRRLFIHEIAHVWQYQNKVLNPMAEGVKLTLKHRFNYSASYFFQLDAAKDLKDYGMEQQAAILEEYFLLKHENVPGLARHCQNSCDEGEKKKLYEKVLKNFLKNPAYARRAKFPKV